MFANLFEHLSPALAVLCKAKQLQEMASAVVATYGHTAADVDAMAGIGRYGNQPAHGQRNLLNIKH